MKVCIVGIGKLGFSVASALLESGNDITVIDKDSLRIQDAGSILDALTVCGDALKTETLKEIDIAHHDLIIAATESDEKNLLICSFAKKLGCSKAIARARDPQHVKQWDFIKETLGIEQILNPDYSCAEEIYKYLTEQYSLKGGIFTQDGMSILEFAIEKIPGLAGKKVMESNSFIPGILIAAISRNGKIIIPNGSSELIQGDTLYCVGLEKDILKLQSKVRSKEKNELPQRVMIAGGGKTGFFLAKMLEERGIAVKILEVNNNRCRELADELTDTVVLNGDASEISVLLDEGLESMDAFVAATGFDEENLLLSLLVKQHGVSDVVAKVSRKTFIPVIKQLGTSAIINPQEIVANSVLSFVRKNGVVLFSKIINGQAEFREILAEAPMPITSKSLAELSIPEGVIILAVHRGKNIFIPNGSTRIAAGDRVVMLSLLSAGGELESLLTKSTASVL